MKPLVSVVMACYREPLVWFELAIDSILNQTLANLELIVVVDDPNNQQIIEFLNNMLTKEPRLKVLVNDHNIGLPDSLNRGVASAKSDFIARMDADDISHVERLRLQFDFLQTNGNVSLVGTEIENIDENNRVVGTTHYHNNPELIKRIIPYCSVACHPSWMFRKSIFEMQNGYRSLHGAEDYDFLYRMIDAGFLIANINVPLLKYRIHNNSITSNMNLSRYRVREYVLLMHKERALRGHDSYSKEAVAEVAASINSNKSVSILITKLRKAVAAGSLSKILYMSALFFCSKEIRRRILDHIKLKIILTSSKLSNSQGNNSDR